jgi:hypothetical protein
MQLILTIFLWILYLISLWPVLLLLGMKPQFIGWSILLSQIGLVVAVKLNIFGLNWSLNKVVILLLCINIVIAIAELSLVAKSINQEHRVIENKQNINE